MSTSYYWKRNGVTIYVDDSVATGDCESLQMRVGMSISMNASVNRGDQEPMEIRDDMSISVKDLLAYGDGKCVKMSISAVNFVAV
jgi:hypothetical protein